ncbi:cupin domain-containing protein [Castellaniella sp.]|uniref:cupin domain-containing protein n=1 Tax=Castellaniella sp. TaxID=1955812 RepID=UPI003560C862
MKAHQVDWDSIPWTPVRDGVERKSFSGEGATLALHRLAPGHEPKPHAHPHEQIAYILAGRIRFHIADESILMGPGQLVVIPPNTRHWGVVVGEEPVLNLDIFTPKRPEYGG